MASVEEISGAEASAVRPVALPAEIRRLTGLPRLDYSDCVVADGVPASERSAEDWARAVIEGASARTRSVLRHAWALLGVRLGSADDPSLVLGWPVRRRGPDLVVLAAGSPIGIDAEVLCRVQDDRLLMATFMHLKNPLARLTWALVAPSHQRIVPRLIRQAIRRTSEEDH